MSKKTKTEDTGRLTEKRKYLLAGMLCAITLLALSIGLMGYSGATASLGTVDILVLLATLGMSFGYYLGSSLLSTEDTGSSFAWGFLLVFVIAAALYSIVALFIVGQYWLLFISMVVLLGGFGFVSLLMQTKSIKLNHKMFAFGLKVFCTRLSWTVGWAEMLAKFVAPIYDAFVSGISSGAAPSLAAAFGILVVGLIALGYLYLRTYRDYEREMKGP